MFASRKRMVGTLVCLMSVVVYSSILTYKDNVWPSFIDDNIIINTEFVHVVCIIMGDNLHSSELYRLLESGSDLW